MFGRTFRRSPWYRRVPDSPAPETRVLEVAVAGQGAATSALGNTISMAVSVAGTGAVVVAIEPSGFAVSIAGTGTVAPALTQQIPVQGSIAGTGSLLINLITDSTPIIGVVGGVYGRFFRRSPITGRAAITSGHAVSISGTSAVTANLDIAVVELATTISGRAHLEQHVPPLPYNVIGPDLRITRGDFAMNVVGNGSLTGALNAQLAQVVSVSGTGVLVADMAPRIELLVAVAGLGVLVSDFQLGREMAVDIEGTDEFGANLGLITLIQASINGDSEVVTTMLLNDESAAGALLRMLMGIGR